MLHKIQALIDHLSARDPFSSIKGAQIWWLQVKQGLDHSERASLRNLIERFLPSCYAHYTHWMYAKDRLIDDVVGVLLQVVKVLVRVHIGMKVRRFA